MPKGTSRAEERQFSHYLLSSPLRRLDVMSACVEAVLGERIYNLRNVARLAEANEKSKSAAKGTGDVIDRSDAEGCDELVEVRGEAGDGIAIAGMLAIAVAALFQDKDTVVLADAPGEGRSIVGVAANPWDEEDDAGAIAAPIEIVEPQAVDGSVFVLGRLCACHLLHIPRALSGIAPNRALAAGYRGLPWRHRRR